jgi:hypothetical protein
MQPDRADNILAALDADAADERRYKLLAATTDEEDDRVIELSRATVAARRSAASPRPFRSSDRPG